MAWVKVPLENHPLFHAALPTDLRVETMKMFGGVAAKVNGNIFAGLFGLSTMVLLGEKDTEAAMKLEGADYFDPMGNGRVRSDKVMLPVSVMHDPKALRLWIGRAFEAAQELPKKEEKAKPAKEAPSARKTLVAKLPAGRAAAKKPAVR
jgi:hypothetical protein